MASLADVQRMLKQGDRKRAALILQRVLKENPSADAWYLAARLTKSPEKTQTYLQNALKLDPNHTRTQNALAKIAGARAAASIDTGTDTDADDAPAEPREPWPMWLRVLAPLTIMIVVVIATSVVLNLLSPLPDQPDPTAIPPTQLVSSSNSDASSADSGDSGETSSTDDSDNQIAANPSAGGGRAVFPTEIPDPNASPTPPPRPITIQPVTAGVVADHFEANFFGAALNPMAIENTNAGTAWTIDFESGSAAQLLLYPSVDALTSDEPFFAQQLQNEQALNTYHTLALLHSQDLPPGDLISLAQWLDRTPITANEQAALQEILTEIRSEGQ